MFFDHYNHVHGHAGIGPHTPASVDYGTAAEIPERRPATLDGGYAVNSARSATDVDATKAAHGRLDQRAVTGGTHRIRTDLELVFAPITVRFSRRS